jgi:hypothetical protein
MTARRHRCDPSQQITLLTQLAFVTTLELRHFLGSCRNHRRSCVDGEILFHPVVDRRASLTHATRHSPSNWMRWPSESRCVAGTGLAAAGTVASLRMTSGPGSLRFGTGRRLGGSCPRRWRHLATAWREWTNDIDSDVWNPATDKSPRDLRALFSLAALLALPRIAPDVNVVHAHDWRTALAIPALRAISTSADHGRRPVTVFSVHNAG